MNKSEVKEQNASNPTIDRSIGLKVWVIEHSFDILGINFNDQVLYSNKIESIVA